MITVVGSLNIDLNITLDKFVEKGETLASQQLVTTFGGKGGNQAIAATRLGEKVQFIGALGNDAHGESYRQKLQEENICIDGVYTLEQVPTGTAVVMLAEKDNAIIVVSGANGALTKEMIMQQQDKIINSQFIVMQFEVSDEVIDTVLTLADNHHVPVLLNPAPFRKFPQEWINKITYLTPNESEYRALLASGVHIPLEKLIVTKGANGVECYVNEEKIQIFPPQVNVVDTTGAGDTFNGALATMLVAGKSLQDACEFATVAASLSTEHAGAQQGMPTKEKVLLKLQESRGEHD